METQNKNLDPFQYCHVKHNIYETIKINFRNKVFEVYKKPTNVVTGLTSSYKGTHFIINDEVVRSSKKNVINWILKNA
jgi:hypothetical protein